MQFKNNKELISFIVINFLSAPIMPILAGLKWGVIGFVASMVLVLISFKVWKSFVKNDSKLSVSPMSN